MFSRTLELEIGYSNHFEAMKVAHGGTGKCHLHLHRMYSSPWNINFLLIIFCTSIVWLLMQRFTIIGLLVMGCFGNLFEITLEARKDAATWRRSSGTKALKVRRIQIVDRDSVFVVVNSDKMHSISLTICCMFCICIPFTKNHGPNPKIHLSRI